MLTGTLIPASNKADWAESVELVDDETGEAIDLSDVDEITVVVSDGCPVLTATKTGGSVSVIQTGIFEFTFTASQMNTLCAKDYSVGCTLQKDDQTIQLIIATVQVRDGIVS